MSSSSNNLCVISDEQLKEYESEFSMLKENGIDFVFEPSAEKALSMIPEMNPDSLMLGSDLGDYEGIEFLAMVMSKYKNFEKPVVVLPDKEDGLPPMVHSRTAVGARSSVSGTSFDEIATIIKESSNDESGSIDIASIPPETTEDSKIVRANLAASIADSMEEASSEDVEIGEQAPKAISDAVPASDTEPMQGSSGKGKWLVAAALVVIALGAGGYFALSGGEQEETIVKKDADLKAPQPPEIVKEKEPVVDTAAEGQVEGDQKDPEEVADQAVEPTPEDVPDAPKEIVLPIAFDIGRDDPYVLDKKELKNIVESLNDQPDSRIVITGHASAEGGAINNFTLAISRAKSAMKLLVKRGVAVDRFELKSIGSNAPIASNESADGREKNRRVSIQIIP